MTIIGKINESIFHTKEKECKKKLQEKEKNTVYNTVKSKNDNIEKLKYLNGVYIDIDDLMEIRQLIKHKECPITDDDNEIFKIAGLAMHRKQALDDAAKHKIYNQADPDDRYLNSLRNGTFANEWRERNDYYNEYTNNQIMDLDGKYLPLIVQGKMGTLFKKSGGKKRKTNKRKTNKRKTNKRKTNKRKTKK